MSEKDLVQEGMDLIEAVAELESLSPSENAIERVLPVLKDYMEEENHDDKLPPYIIKKIKDLGLCYKTYFHRQANKTDLEICRFHEDGTRYTIASFDYDPDEYCWCLNSCVDRLNSTHIDWEIFGMLVLKGYKLLNKYSKE